MGRPGVDDAPGGPLAGTLVVELSSGIAGAYCTKLLADGGADVVKVEDPTGDPLRRWSASGATIADGDDGALFSFLAGSKRSVVVDPAARDASDRLDALFAAADVVVWSEGSGLAALPSCAPDAITRAHPHVVVATITPFGLDGPWAGRPATEFTLQAWSGGAVGLGRGYPDRSPLVVGGQVGEWLAGTYAAIGVLASRARHDGRGELVDVSMLEAVATCLTYYPVTFAEIAGRPYRSGRSVPSPGVESASDGLVGLGTGTGQQWLDLCVMVGHPEWADDATLRTERWRIAPEIRAWAAHRTVAEIVDLAAAFRIPHAPVGNGATIPTTDHFVARGSLVANPRDGFLQPGPPYRTTPDLLRPPAPAPRLGEHDAELGVSAGSPQTRARAAHAGEEEAAPLAGVRVLDLTAFWAGPVVTQMLAMLGAEVIHVESPTRPDGTRMLANLPFTDDQWWERCGIFSALNVDKQSVTLDLADERGRAALRTLLATCDVLVENYTPRVLEQLGLDFESARAIRPDLVMVRMPGFGLDGPWRDNAAFAFVVEDAAGFTWMTGYPDTNPISPYCIGDPAAGLHALTGLLLALEQRRRTGEGVLVEAAMVDAALNVTAEQVVEHSAYGALLHRDGNRGPTAAPQNLYRAADPPGADDSWVAIAVATDAQWRALVDVLAWDDDPALHRAAARRARHDEIDARLAEWCASRTPAEIVELLWPAGVPVAPVVLPHEQAGLAQLQHRGWFEVVDHPVNGPAQHSTLPMRFSRRPERVITRHAPLFGEHTDAVLRAAGVSEADLAELYALGVTARSPAGAAG